MRENVFIVFYYDIFVFTHTRFYGLRNSFAIWAALEIAFDVDIDIHLSLLVELVIYGLASYGLLGCNAPRFICWFWCYI